MARGFTLQDIACLTLDGSLQGTSSPPSVEPSKTASSESTESLRNRGSFLDKEQLSKASVHEQMYEADKMSTNSSSSSSGSSGGSDQEDARGEGLFATGFSWFDKRREKRRREQLQLEAEQQLQKIGEAQRAAHANSERSFPNHALADSSSSSSQEPSDSLDQRSSADHHRLPKAVDVDGSSSRSLFAAAGEKSQQLHYVSQKSHSFGEADVSKSGEGASGMLYLSDIDGICGDVHEELPASNNAVNQDSISDPIDEGVAPSPVRVTHTEGDEASPYILSLDQMNEISKHVLPETISYCRWRRLYGLGRDGDSFDGCLRIIGSEKRTLMVVRTSKGDVFGGYADSPWHSRRNSSMAKFYGSASSCLYSFSSTLTPYSTSSSPESSPIHVYRWTGKNRYIQVCDVSNKMLAFGGGGDKGAFGLCLQEDFQRGTTGHCDTFDNDPLCSGHERTFDIVDLEFWEFQTGVF
eukprot:CAMPEP_0197181056 /NCGR_PEP_ID=MMETSP1423-20130617/5448_1 /TAXON_ID=476441 /ORGANISM="Pseudo-nitzschia heimii, Strain UNC1101" /LENGTH=466 /DNA_ID=CAMNT_0042631225 /DNA_START=149 /DNA_END=1549 /DNA_ORIENTATION=-